MKTPTLKIRYVFAFFAYLTVSVTTAQVGINTIDPKSTLDVNGALSLRGSAISLINGDNINVNLGAPAFSHYRIIGPTSNFKIKTINTAPGDGQILTLINTTDQRMTIAHDDGPGAFPERKIYCPGETDFDVSGKNSTVTLQFNIALSRWVVINYAEKKASNSKSAVGTTSITTNSSNWVDMDPLSITFIPKNPVIFVNFSVSGLWSSPGGNGAFDGIANFRLLYNNNQVITTQTFAGTRYYLDAGFFTIDFSFGSWNSSLPMVPIAVTPGQSTTIKVQWRREGDGTLRCLPSNPNTNNHRYISIIDE